MPNGGEDSKGAGGSGGGGSVIVKEKSMKFKCPEFNGKQEDYEEWKIIAEDWIWMTKDEVKGQGVVLRQAVKGKALQVLLDIDKETIRGSNGADEVIKRLDAVYKKEEVFEHYGKALAFLKIERKKKETMNEFLQRYDHAAYCCKREGEAVIQGNMRAVHLMEAARLTDDQTHMVIAASGKDKLNFDTIKMVLKRMFESTEKGEKVEESWMEGRGMNLRGEGNRETDKGQKNPMRFGRVTTCAVCGSEYHWARQCPKNVMNRNKREIGQGDRREAGHGKSKEDSKEEKGNKVYMSTEEDAEFWNEVEGILDTGCKNSVIGNL